MNIAHDYTGDGFPDVVVSEGRSFVMYVNPGKELRRWDRYPAFANTAEVVAFRDVTGDGAPDVVVLNSGMVSVATVNTAAPTSPWTVHPCRAPVTPSPRSTVLAPVISTATAAWTSSLRTDGGNIRRAVSASPWPYHPVAFGRWPRAGASPGGGELRVADFNGDGLNDVVASLEAHGWGLAWFEQKRSAAGEASWAQHMIIDDLASKNPGGVAISEIHAITTADVDGDGIDGRHCRQAAVLASRQLYGSRSARRCGALRVPDRARQTRAGRRDVRPAVGPQPIRCRLDGADCRFEQGRRRRHPHGDEPRHVHFLGHREERCAREVTNDVKVLIVGVMALLSCARDPRTDRRNILVAASRELLSAEYGDDARRTAPGLESAQPVS